MPKTREARAAPATPLSLDALDDDVIIPASEFGRYGLPEFSKPARRRLIDAGKFPAPLEISPNRVGWRAGDLKLWRASRPVRRGYSAPINSAPLASPEPTRAA